MAITVYSDDPLSNGFHDVTVIDKLVRIAPNPSQGIFSIQFNLITQTDLDIEITDMTGKVVYFNDFVNISIKKTRIKFRAKPFKSGYVCLQS